MSIISELRRLRQAVLKFKASVGYTVRPYLKGKKKKK
jgi:hypothetical protein